MQIGLVGLGKMGRNLALNLKEHGHEVIGYDRDVAGEAETLAQLARQLEAPRLIWLMVPAGEATQQVIDELMTHLESGDVLVDGGNADYKDTVRRAETLKQHGVTVLDCGTSGGIEGARHGICAMVGGEQGVFQQYESLFRDVSLEGGYLYAGPAGSGHFLKMVHNGIEYGMMQAIAEGFGILEKSGFDYDFQQVAAVWGTGSIIRSYLMETAERAFTEDPDLSGLRGVMHASGEGRWTVETALELEVPAPVIAMSLMMRNRSLEADSFSGKVVAAMRREFGGHAVEPNEAKE